MIEDGLKPADPTRDVAISPGEVLRAQHIAEHREPLGVRFFDRSSEREMMLVEGDGHLDGWLVYPMDDGDHDGIREATDLDRERIDSAKKRLAAKIASVSASLVELTGPDSLPECYLHGGGPPVVQPKPTPPSDAVFEKRMIGVLAGDGAPGSRRSSAIAEVVSLLSVLGYERGAIIAEEIIRGRTR